MCDRPSQPPAVSLPPGTVTNMSVTYLVNTARGPERTFHGLQAMQRYACPHHVQELTQLLTVICEQVLAGRPARSMFALPPGTVRIPAGPPAGTAAPAAAPCRARLAAVRDALDCPPNDRAAAATDLPRLRAERARLALAALRPVLAERGPGLAGAHDAATLLRQRIAACTAEGRGHSPLTS
jgi:hypothetical protein